MKTILSEHPKPEGPINRCKNKDTSCKNDNGEGNEINCAYKHWYTKSTKN